MLSGFLRPRCCVVALWLGVTVGGCVCGKRRPGPPVVYDGAPAVADAERDEPLPRRCGDIRGERPSPNSVSVRGTNAPWVARRPQGKFTGRPISADAL